MVWRLGALPCGWLLIAIGKGSVVRDSLRVHKRGAEGVALTSECCHIKVAFHCRHAGSHHLVLLVLLRTLKSLRLLHLRVNVDHRDFKLGLVQRLFNSESNVCVLLKLL